MNLIFTLVIIITEILQILAVMMLGHKCQEDRIRYRGDRIIQLLDLSEEVETLVQVAIQVEARLVHLKQVLLPQGVEETLTNEH